MEKLVIVYRKFGGEDFTYKQLEDIGFSKSELVKTRQKKAYTVLPHATCKWKMVHGKPVYVPKRYKLTTGTIDEIVRWMERHQA